MGVKAGSGSTVSISDVVALAPADDRLPEGIRALLIREWGDRPAGEIAAMSVFAIASELLAVAPDGDYSNDDRFRAAEGLHDLLKRAGLAEQPQAGPVKVTVDLPKSPEQMALRELLSLLASEPERHGEIRPYLDRQPQVRAAGQNTNGAWVIPGAGGSGIDVEATVAYVSQVSRRHASAQRKFKDRRPVSLPAALGLDDRALIHPFTGRPAQGPDSNGFDFSQLDPQLHEALLWAAVTQHPAWPQQVDLYTFSEQVFQNPLPHRWKLILEDYQAARAGDEDSVRLITRHWPREMPLDEVIDLAAGPGLASGGVRGSRVNYEQLVTQRAEMAGPLIGSGFGNDYDGGVFTSIQLSGCGHDLSRIAVIRGGQISGSGHDGTILLPPGVRVRVTGSGNSIKQVSMTWEELARELRLS